jgi:hypothetical protein
MRSRTWKRRARKIARGFGYLMGLVATALSLSWLEKRRLRAHPRVPKTSDERTMRRIAEAQAGGMSSEEGRARYERGEHPGGLHGKAERDPDAESVEAEEPHDRLEIHRGSRRVAMPSMRR